MFLIVEVGVLIARSRDRAGAHDCARRRCSRCVCLAVVFVDVMRGVPVILLYLVGFGVPALDLSGVPKGATCSRRLALGMCYSAYVAEVFRAGIQSVHPSQGAAALALGLTRRAGAAPRRRSRRRSDG